VKRKVRKILTFYVSLFVFTLEVWACRPLVTEDAGTVSSGKPGLEISLEHCEEETVFCPVIMYGLRNKLDIGTEIPIVFRPEQKVNELTLRAKIGIYEVNGLSLLVKPFFVFPLVSEEKPEFTLLGAISKNFKKYVLHFNLGMGKNLFSGLASELSLSDRLRLLGEVYAENIFSSENTMNLRLGMVWRITSFVDLDFAVDRRFHPGTQTVFVSGLTFNF